MIYYALRAMVLYSLLYYSRLLLLRYSEMEDTTTTAAALLLLHGRNEWNGWILPNSMDGTVDGRCGDSG